MNCEWYVGALDRFYGNNMQSSEKKECKQKMCSV